MRSTFANLPLGVKNMCPLVCEWDLELNQSECKLKQVGVILKLNGFNMYSLATRILLFGEGRGWRTRVFTTSSIFTWDRHDWSVTSNSSHLGLIQSSTWGESKWAEEWVPTSFQPQGCPQDTHFLKKFMRNAPNLVNVYETCPQDAYYSIYG